MVLTPPLPVETRPTCWSLDLLQSLDWRVFEELFAELARRRGYDSMMIYSLGSGPDGRIDILLRQPGAAPSAGYTIAVHCMQRKGLVSAETVREFLGVLKRRRFEKGFLVTSNGFTDGALDEFGGREDVQLIDGERVLHRVREFGEEEESRLLKFATGKSDWYVPTCQRCNVKMVARVTTTEEGPRPFWGCRNDAAQGCGTRVWVA